MAQNQTGNQSQTELLGGRYWAQSHSVSFKIIWMMGLNASSASLQMTRNLEGR